ncbi:ATP-binding protein [Hymenobacter arizonensis]|uniref:histidine kinase n=1 Tax=Hymenobacter arizonensis TaxID=1227077 RepID=A0A1I6B9Z7_HYMAR|nr:ATP-binding protein [Hymenobacter arizonensis]SFQ77758.1 His Kinase A (phospho-acceptor) domain-containing protein [Hymenobacter arizonensis]
MRYFLLLLACWLLALVAQATPLPPDTAVLQVNRLPDTGLLLEKGWRYHAGDNPAWARPDFDDSGWDTLNPTRPRRELPAALGTGISWLRLRIRLGDSLRRHELLAHTLLLGGACEVYLNGNLMQRHGLVDLDPAQVRPQKRLAQPDVVLASGSASEQVLAVRYAPWQGPLLGGLVQRPLLRMTLVAPQHFWARRGQDKDNALMFVVLMGFSALLAVLHFAFFHYNPSQRANLYFALFALTAALGSLTAYLFRVLPISFPDFLSLVVVSNALAAMNGLWAIRALYALFKIRPGRFYQILWVNYGVLVVLYAVFGTFPVVDYWWTIVVLVHLSEQVRLTVRGVRQRQRGAGLVALGFAGGLGSALAYALVFFLLGPVALQLLQNLLLALGFALPALGISLFLAREFALDAELLQVKLGEVECLSAQTLAQEQEKQALLATQNETLEQQVSVRTGELQRSLTELRATQAQLIQKEKMASLGELTAGIAHEIQNPLNFVNNFSEVSTELVAELREERAKGAAADTGLEEELWEDLTQNLGKIHHHGQRAASIVRGMLEHSRTSAGERAPTDLNALCEEYLRLAYQGLRAKDKSFNAELKTYLAPDLPLVNAVGADLGRVLLNLFNNAFYAVQQRQRANGEPGYMPTVSLTTKHVGSTVEIQVTDNGTGMSEAVQQKIFQPFFTTKPTGEGTGLGLSLSHDIVAKGHGGSLTVESQPGQGTTFSVALPLTKTN